MEGNRKIVFLLVNYFNEAEVKSYILNQLFAQSVATFEIMLVNNSQDSKSSLKEFSAAYANITCLEPGKNLGYMGAASYAYQQYIKLNPVPEFVILCNTDIEIRDNDFIKKLLNLSIDKTVGVIGPSVISTINNKDSNPYIRNRVTTSHLKFLKSLYSYYLFYAMYEYAAHVKKLIFKSNNTVGTSKFIYAVHGSFIIFTRKYFQSGANLNYNAFLFGEEIFVAERARKFNLLTAYEPALKVFHLEHSTTGLIKSKRNLKRMKESVEVLLKDYFTNG